MVNCKLICELMKEKGITAEEMARTVGLSKTMMSYILNGLREPNLISIVRIAGVLGCTVDELIIKERS